MKSNAMNSATGKAVRNIVLLGILVGGSSFGLLRLSRYVEGDAFSGLARPTVRPDAIVTLENANVRHYADGKLLSRAAVGRVDVLADHAGFELYDIDDAVYHDGERRVRYTAKHALWNANPKILEVDGGATIKNKDMDLTARALRFNSIAKKIEVKDDVKGRLNGGDLVAKSLILNTETEAYEVGPVRWKGKLSLLEAQANSQNATQEATDLRHWDIRGDKSYRDKKNSDIVVFENGVATDGEVVLIAPKVEWNRKTDLLTATGRVQYFSVKANLVANQATVYRKEKRAVLTGDVVMLVKPKSEQTGKPKVEAIPAFQPLVPDQVIAARAKAKKPVTEEEKKAAEQLRDPKSVRQFPLSMSSSKIEFWYGKGSRRAIVTGDPQARQVFADGKWRHVWTNVAFYDGEKETLKLTSTKDRKDTRFIDSIGDDFVADWMEMSVEEDKEEDAPWTGWGFQGKFISLDDDEDPRKSPPPKR